MTAKRIGKKILKSVGIIVGSFLLLLTVFHFWFVYHAEQIIQDLVSSKSNGKIRLEVKNFKFSWLGRKMELEDVVFYNTDSFEAGTAYRFAVKKIKVKVKAVWPIVFDKKVFINDLSLSNPDIVVTRLRSFAKDTSKTKEDISIPLEMGRIYHSIQDALHVLRVKKFEIENASFVLINKIHPGDVPVKISNIDFHIDNLRIDTGQLTGREKLFFSDNIVLKSKDQDILFPDGRHRLSFSKFRINIEKKIVEFDSCTIAAIKTENSPTGFSIFFDQLKMTDIDFDTLYRAEVIKADSVYCVNPQFKLQVDIDRRAAVGKSPPKLDQLIRQLTGDLMLNFVIVNNASFDINTLRNGKPSSFTSSGNNFEMQGLKVDNDAKRPLQVERFVMAIRNYENFLRDSLYALQFDSILVNNDKIYLNNFSFHQRLNGKTVNSLKVPRFQLTGLSWDDLFFEQKLAAQEAVLFNPTIHYTEQPKRNSNNKERRVFDALATMNELLMLEDLHILKGNIDIHLTGGIDMQLREATLSVESRSLLGSSKLSGIRRSVNHLDFSKGYFKVNDITVHLDDIRYTGADSRLNAGNVTVINESKTINALAKNVILDEVFINEITGDVNIAGIKWEEADINLAQLPTGQNKHNKSFISLTDIDGNNTTVTTSFAGKKASAFISHIGAIAILLKPGEEPKLAGLAVTGRDLAFSDSVSRSTIATFGINDLESAVFENISYQKKTEKNTVDIRIPRLSFVPNIQSIIGGEIRTNDITISKPVANIYITTKDPADISSTALRLPVGLVNKLAIEQPEINFSRQNETDITRIRWNGKNAANNSLVLMDVNTGQAAFAARQLYLSLNSFVVENVNGKSFDAGKGEITALINDLRFQKQTDIEAEWQGTIATLEGKNFTLDSLGKKAGQLDIKTIQLKDLTLNSSSLPGIRKAIEENTKFRLQQITGSYVNTENSFYWFNAGYDKSTKLFSLDSFQYSPAVSKEVFVKNHPYQADYLQIKTGAITTGPFDIDKYLRDSVVSIGILKIDDIRFSDFRDNRPPFHSGIIKPLIANRIKSIPFKISIDSILLNNAQVLYAELNPKTNQTGVIPVTRMTLKAFPVRNYDLSGTDSLRLQANGYLMDSIWVRIRLRESYRDSLSGFLLTVRMKPADMRQLNPVLEPLASARLLSGYLDTMSMRVVGNDFLAWGEMEMLYHNLKIQLLRTTDPQKRKFLTGLLNFFANSFVIKNKNTKKIHNVFFIRNRDRSSVNYLIKMVMSGVNSNVGVKSNRKLLRQYKKELQQRNLPPVDYD